MDSGVATALSTGLTSLQTDSLSQLASVLPIGFAVLISVAVTFVAIRWLRALIHI